MKEVKGKQQVEYAERIVPLMVHIAIIFAVPALFAFIAVSFFSLPILPAFFSAALISWLAVISLYLRVRDEVEGKKERKGKEEK